jgi:hypothetical protein
MSETHCKSIIISSPLYQSRFTKTALKTVLELQGRQETMKSWWSNEFISRLNNFASTLFARNFTRKKNLFWIFEYIYRKKITQTISFTQNTTVPFKQTQFLIALSLSCGNKLEICWGLLRKIQNERFISCHDKHYDQLIKNTQ